MKKFVAAFILILLIPFSFSSTVFAQTVMHDEVVTLPKGQTINEDYFAAGEKITISGTINGDAYIAGGNVTVDGTINGDLLVAGGNVVLSGNVKEDIRVAGGEVIISSPTTGNVTILAGNSTLTKEATISGSLVAAGGNLLISSPVRKGITLAAGHAAVSNTVGANVLAAVGEFDINSTANIRGNVTYFSDEEAFVDKEASVAGRLTHQMPNKTFEKDASRAIHGLGETLAVTVTLFDFLTSLVLGLLMVYFFPVYTTAITTYAVKNPLRSFWIGAVALLAIPIIAGVLLITFFGIPFSILLLIYYFLALYCAKVLGAYAVGQKLIPYVKKNVNPIPTFLIGLILFEIIGFIPLVGSLIAFFVVCCVFGALFVEKKNLYNSLRDKKLV